MTVDAKGLQTAVDEFRMVHASNGGNLHASLSRAILAYKSAAPVGARQDRDPRWNVIYSIVRDYRMSNMRDDIGVGYPLVDLMSNDGCSIATGEDEMAALVDDISLALTAYESARSAGPVTSDVERLVIAARAFAYSDPFPEDKTEMDNALEAFAERVAWPDQPEASDV